MSVQVTPHTFELKADLGTTEEWHSSYADCNLVPTSIKVTYVWNLHGWQLLTIYIEGPIRRKKDGVLSSRKGADYFAADSEWRPMASAPAWAREFASAHLPVRPVDLAAVTS